MGTRRSKHNYGRKPRYKDNNPSEVCKAIWDTPNFNNDEASDRHPLEESIKQLFSEGCSVREISEKLNVDRNIVRKIGCVNGKLNPAWEEARRNKYRERNKKLWESHVFREMHSQKRKEIWAKKKETDAALLLPETEKTAQGILSAHPETEWKKAHNKWNQNYGWSKLDVLRLEILANAKVDPSRASTVFQRSEKTIAYKARDIGLYIPPEWSAFLPKGKYIAHPRQPKILLNYPFFIQVDAEKNADLLAVNSLVPKGIPAHMRGDICQDILLAVYEGKANLETLKTRPDLVKQFISSWRKSNLENNGYVMSIDPYGDDKRSFEDKAAARADWDWNQQQESRSNWEAQSMTHTPAHQFDDLYQKEIGRENIYLTNNGHTISYSDTAKRMEEFGAESKWRNLNQEIDRIAYHISKYGFTEAGRNRSQSDGEKNSEYCTISASESRYISFTIPGSNIGKITIRVSNHPDHGSELHQIDTYKLGVDGVIRVLEELAGDKEKYEEIHAKNNDFWDVKQEMRVA